MLMKLAGGVLVLSATIWFGIRCAERVRDEYRQMRYLWRLISVLEGEIDYAHAHLADIFSNMARHSKEPYKGWLYALCREMSAPQPCVFGVVWEESVKGYLGKTALPKRELERLGELGGQLGIYDRSLQLQILREYKRELQAEMYERQGEMHGRIRLCHCLGVMSGILITVLLL